ncbi:MAG: hypothetical protein CM1200mP10_24470 [Candidatus Neomarinimicrobiota bacterium]|nr:MAG: hypothetical protein CM1200mP10_24470 [Candidatus Neomarinimicrobiota bacterium]
MTLLIHGNQIDQNSLKTQLSVAAVVSLSAKLNQGLDDLKEAIITVINSGKRQTTNLIGSVYLLKMN